VKPLLVIGSLRSECLETDGGWTVKCGSSEL
jgi:hypothetical protein